MDSIVKNCIACQAATPEHHRDPLPASKLPECPWTELSLDFAGPFLNGKYAMVVIEDHSKYPVVNILRTLAAPVVFSKLRTIFAQFGIPTVLKTDNGPPFHSGDFSRFAEEFGFKHHRVTPLWPEANGEVQRFMRTLNTLVLTSRIGGKD